MYGDSLSDESLFRNHLEALSSKKADEGEKYVEESSPLS